MKRKEMTKVMAAALAATMAISMVGCGGNGGGEGSSSAPAPESSSAESTPSSEAGGGEESTSSTEEEVSKYTVRTDENGNVYDLGGIEVIVRDWFSGDGTLEEPKNALDEARQEYLDWIQETYNFTIKSMTISGWGDVHTDFVNYATSGGDEYYVFTLWNGAELIQEMKNGLMYDLSTLDCLDFSEDKWLDTTTQLMTINGKIYGMRGDVSEPRGGMFFNKRLLREAGIEPDDLYTYQENMEWTWDKFEELCEQIYADTDNDGTIDRWPIMTFNDPFYTQAVFSNNGSYIGKNPDGTFYNNLESAETLDALNWAREMLTKYRKPDPEGAEWDYCYTGFINGEAAFMADEAYNAGAYVGPDYDGSAKFSRMQDDFGFVCFPMGPAASDYTNAENNNQYVIPACYDADKAWKIAFAYDLYTEPVPGHEDENVMINNYYSSFRDEESVKYTITRLTQNSCVAYHTYVGGIDLGNELLWKFSDENTPAQQAEAIRNTWQSYIDKANGVATEEEPSTEEAAE